MLDKAQRRIRAGVATYKGYMVAGVEYMYILSSSKKSETLKLPLNVAKV